MSAALQMPRARTCMVTLAILAALLYGAKWFYDYLKISI